MKLNTLTKVLCNIYLWKLEEWFLFLYDQRKNSYYDLSFTFLTFIRKNDNHSNANDHLVLSFDGHAEWRSFFIGSLILDINESIWKEILLFFYLHSTEEKLPNTIKQRSICLLFPRYNKDWSPWTKPLTFHLSEAVFLHIGCLWRLCNLFGCSIRLLIGWPEFPI